jgi:hypothetical protein
MLESGDINLLDNFIIGRTIEKIGRQGNIAHGSCPKNGSGLGTSLVFHGFISFLGSTP